MRTRVKFIKIGYSWVISEHLIFLLPAEFRLPPLSCWGPCSPGVLHGLVVCYRRFGTTYRSRREGRSNLFGLLDPSVCNRYVFPSQFSFHQFPVLVLLLPGESTVDLLEAAVLRDPSIRTNKYRGADKSVTRPRRKQATATEDFDVHIPYLWL